MATLRIATITAMLLGMCVGAADAQEFPRPRAEWTNLDVSMLPVNVNRIRRELRQALAVSQEQDGLNLRYQVEVYGEAPDIRLFTPEDDLTTGPVPYGAPTHREIVNHITPQEFRAPVMDFSALMQWLAEKARQ